MVQGISATSGGSINGVEHLRQSVQDILSTPVGSRVMRREYGSRLFDLVDRPASESLRLELMAATFDALEEWEPRFALETVEVAWNEDAQVTVDLTGSLVSDGTVVDLQGVVIA